MSPDPTPAGGPVTSPASGPLCLAVPACPADAGVLSDVIAEAFHPLAPSQWLIPDQAARRQIFPGYFRLFVEHALATGVVHTTPDRAAAALWLPAGPGGPVPPDAYAERLAAATGAWAHRFRAFDAALDARHLAGVAHVHLALLAVRPDRQGEGTGTALLRAHHRTLDHHARLPAYLEASDLRTRQLYLREGYADHGRPVRLPGDVPDGPALRRHARPRRTETTAMTEQGTPGDAVQVPEVVARYAAYLRARTHLSAEITMERDRADARVGRDAATLVLVFRRRGENEWEPGGAEVQRGALAGVFARGQVARAVSAFLGDEPLTPASASGKGNPCRASCRPPRFPR